MGWYEHHVVPRIVNLTCANSRMLPLRQRALAGVSGTVVELGFGSGPNLAAYPAAVERVIAIEPSDVGKSMAAKRVAASSIPVEFAGLDGQQLPLDDASADHVVSTWTLCTIPDAIAAMQEVRRVLRPGGAFTFLEHGLSPDAKVARRQHRFNGVQRRIAGGCNLDRDISAVVQEAGFTIDDCSTFYIAGPKALCFMYSGVARPVQS
jgi:ubiquinone/menaquinone biosynthesis C-methylase UbiE